MKYDNINEGSEDGNLSMIGRYLLHVNNGSFD